MRTKLLAALLGYCIVTVAVASDPQIPNTALQDFRGQYDLADGRLLTITQRGQHLMMQLDHQPEAEVVQIGATAFVDKSGEVRLEFTQYPNGNVAEVQVIQLGQNNLPGLDRGPAYSATTPSSAR